MYSYDGNFGINTINAIQNYYNLSPLQIHYDSPTQAILPSQQFCSTAEMMNRWQAQQTMNCLQSQMQSLKNSENAEKLINSIKPIKFEEEKGEDMVCENISDYMDKEFLYESELKEIEDKFHFKFYDLFRRLPEQDGILYKISKKIVEELNLKNNSKNLYVREIRLYRFYAENQIRVFFNEDITNELLITVDKSDWKKLVGKDMNYLIEIVIRMCNMLIRQEIPEYQQFYEKYKNRIVKDNEYEDLSYYEKILKENT